VRRGFNEVMSGPEVEGSKPRKEWRYCMRAGRCDSEEGFMCWILDMVGCVVVDVSRLSDVTGDEGAEV